MQIRNATTPNIHPTTKTTTKQHRNTTATEVQPTGTKINTAKNQGNKRGNKKGRSYRNRGDNMLESTCYIREMMEDWQNINLIKSVNFTNEKVSDINKTRRGQFWIKTRTNNQQVFWLVDTGSPRSFMNTETARKLLVNEKTTIHESSKSIGEFRCFNNNKIDVTGIIKVDITSGSYSAKTE